jgi:hypothetical protein
MSVFVPLEQVGAIFLPLHVNGNHWVLAVAVRQKEELQAYCAKHWTVFLLDSMCPVTKIRKANREYRRDALLLAKLCDALELNVMRRHMNRATIEARVRSREEDHAEKGLVCYNSWQVPCPQQSNGNDCGIFTLVAMIHVAGSGDLFLKDWVPPTPKHCGDPEAHHDAFITCVTSSHYRTKYYLFFYLSQYYRTKYYLKKNK